MAADKNKEAAPVLVTYAPGDLIQAAYVFGTTPELMAGALYGVTDELTREAAAGKLEAFLKRVVTPQDAAQSVDESLNKEVSN
jgi:hypothetical protein